MKSGVYRHFKGKYYLVLFTAIHSETRELMVVYKPLYDSGEEFVVRPLIMFQEQVQKYDNDSQLTPRFKYVGELH